MTVRDETFEPGSDRGSGFGSFFSQSLSGAALLVLLTLHMIAQHFIVSGGLRDYADVVAWLGNPAVVLIELAFLVFVTWHAMLGVRAILFDFGPGARAARVIDVILWLIGLGSVAYGVWLVITIVNS
jgi:succinate dehydrogenase / fumarate reductase membrane anchor subunit